MGMLSIHNNKVQMIRESLTFFAWAKRNTTILAVLKEAADGLDEDHPLVQAIAFLDGVHPDYDPDDRSRAVAGFDLNSLPGYVPKPDTDMILEIQNKAHRFMEDGGKIRYGEESKQIAALLNANRAEGYKLAANDPMLVLCTDAAMDLIKQDPRVCRLNGNGEEMNGKGRWTEIAHKGRYQITA